MHKKSENEKMILKNGHIKHLIVTNVLNILLLKNFIKIERLVEDCSVSATTNN